VREPDHEDVLQQPRLEVGELVEVVEPLFGWALRDVLDAEADRQRRR